MEKASLGLPGALTTATRIDKTIRPAQLGKVLDASGFGAESLLERLQRTRIILAHDPQYYMLWLLE